MKQIRILFGAFALLSLLSAGALCAAAAPQDQKRPPKPVRVDVATVKRLFGSDPTVEAVDNPITPEKLALGKLLFHDKGLSASGQSSCATCHDLANYGIDGKPASIGADGKPEARNTPSVYNAARQFVQFWDGRAKNVEEAALVHALEPAGLGLGDEAALLGKLKARPELGEAFGKAFPGGDAVSVEHYRLAMGAYLRSLTTKSRFEAFLDGDMKALSNEEKQGLNDFQTIGCITCHTTRLVGGQMYQKSGLLAPYPSEDLGRAALTGSTADKQYFKVPSLQNVEKTAPYYHDGKVATLEEAVVQMAKMQLAKDLTAEQTASLVAFLKSLTGPLPTDEEPKKPQ